MNCLLDTHTWLWLLHEPHKLSPAATRAIAKPANTIHLSPVSIWEAAQLHRRKRIATRFDFPTWLQKALAAAPLTEAPFTTAIATQATLLHLPQPDFADTFLAATAIVSSLTLITADEQLLTAPWLKTLSATS